MVRVDVDKSGRAYVAGEHMRVKVLSEQDGYLYLFNVDSNGEIGCLFPNKYQSDNRIKAGQEIEVGGNDKFRLGIREPFGTELLKAVVSKQPLKSVKPEDLIDKDGAPRSIKDAQARKIIIEALTGDPDLAKGDDPIDKIREDFKDKHPDEFKKRSEEFAEHQIEITTSKERVETTEKRVGVFIGVSDYQDKSIRSLSVPHKDAAAMAAVMKDEGKFDKTYLLVNKDATLANIRAHICEKLVQDTHPGDTVMIYWSGHGGRCTNTDGTEPDGFDEFLVPYDGSLDLVRKTMLLDKTMARWVQELDGRKVMVVLDTCHSGGFGAVAKGIHKDEEKFVKGLGNVGTGKWTKPHFLATELARAKSIGQKDAAVLASSTAKQVSFETRNKGLSVMTYFITGLVKKSTHTLTLEDVYDGVKDDVRKYVDKEFEGTVQTPIFSDQIVKPPAKFRP
jgi:hypothetical protein